MKISIQTAIGPVVLMLLFAIAVGCGSRTTTPPVIRDMRTASVDAAIEGEPDLAGPVQRDLSTLSCTFDRDCGDPGIRCCAGTCRSYTDRQHCGSCGTSCGTDPSVGCCGTKTEARCVNLRADREHCGMCGGTCREVTVLCCDGSCIAKASDRNNCGMCGNKCPGLAVCFNGMCVPP